MEGLTGWKDLSVAQVRRAFRVAADLADLDDPSDFPGHSTVLLRELIPCDHSGYNDIDVRTQQAWVLADPPDVVFEGGPEILARFAEQNPIIARAKDGDMAPLRLSDHITSAQWHKTDIYNYVYRRSGVEHQLCVQLPSASRPLSRRDKVIGFSFSRGSHDFSDHERSLLGVMRPVLAATVERLQQKALLRAVVTGDGPPSRLLVLVDPEATVIWASDRARDVLSLTEGGNLPFPVTQWLSAERGRLRDGRQARSSALFGTSLRAQLVVNAYPYVDAIFFTQERSEIDADELRQLGLTKRQAAVLVLLARGMSNREIAEVMVLSRRTVERHLDDIYRCLGVRRRAQAILAALGGLRRDVGS